MLITYPLTQPDQPRWPTFGCFHSTGLQFDAYTVSSRGLTAINRGNCITRTVPRRRHADSRLLMLPNPHAWGAGTARHRQNGREKTIWIGYCVLDRLISYSEASFLSKTELPIQNTRHRQTAGTGGPGCGARGRWRGLAGQRADAPSHTSAPQAPPVWRAPEGPEGTGGLRGAAPNEVKTPSLAGGRALRRPEHPWGHKQHHTRIQKRPPGTG